MKKLSMLITENSSVSPISVAQTLMMKFGKGYKSEWRVFLNKVLEHVYKPLNMWYSQKDNEGRYKLGVWTNEGVWHPILNRVNTNYIVMGKLLQESGINLNQPIDLIYSSFIQYFRKNYRSIVSEDGDLYNSIVLPTIGRTSAKGEKTEEESIKLLNDCPLFNGLTIEKLGGSGVGADMIDGVDAITYKTTPEEITHTIQIKPFTHIKKSDYGHFINGVGQAKEYRTNFIVFVKGSSYIVADSKKCKPLKGSYFVSKGGILFQKGVSQLNEDFSIMRNLLSFKK